MKKGIVVPQHSGSIEDVVSAAKMAEEAGLDSLWVSDHLHGRTRAGSPFLEAWTCLSAIAPVTDKIRLGTLVARVGLRRPAVLLSMAKTVNGIAPGRLTLGFGLGDSTNFQEQRAYGVPLEPRKGRIVELEEIMHLFRTSTPEIPLWLGGTGESLMNLLPNANGWNFWGPIQGFFEMARKARTAGGDELEVSWAGSFKDFDPMVLRQARAGHIILATGSLNYADRIDFLADID